MKGTNIVQIGKGRCNREKLDGGDTASEKLAQPEWKPRRMTKNEEIDNSGHRI